jgi:AdoMet-dependent rRNA methyltransferase SPB1
MKAKKAGRVKKDLKRKADPKSDLSNFFNQKDIDVVAPDDESLDSDDMAITRAMGKVMLRKKARREIIDASYNRYSTHHDDPSKIPAWFLEDEAKHYRPNLPITKEQVDEEKAIMKEYNARPSKKVSEAKARKKKKLFLAMNRVKAKAQAIADMEINEGSKMRQIQKLYSKERLKHKETKEYVVSRSFNTGSGKQKTPRHIKMVDSRMRKDERKQKQTKKGKAIRKKK